MVKERCERFDGALWERDLPFSVLKPSACRVARKIRLVGKMRATRPKI